MKHFIYISFVFICMFGMAQKATISGKVTDKDMNNESLPFANVIIKGTQTGTTTDDEGNYTLSVDPGNLNVEFSFLGYETVVVPVVIKAGQTLKLNQILGSGEGMKLEDVVIATSRRKNTESALIAEIKEAKQVISAISAEQISKGTDGNAAQAIQRVPGITINDGKYIIVRGLSERYNNVLINNALAPSTEVDRRTFSFDLIPSNVIERMVISKSGTAYLPGDFSGGLVNVTTSENFTEFTQASVNVGYRTNTTFGDYFQTEGSSTDFLGFDNGFRKLPGDFPSNNNFFNNNSQSVEQANRLPNNFTPQKNTAFFDTGVGFSLGRKIKLKKGTLSTINALSYSNKFENYDKLTAQYINDNTNFVAQDDREFNDGTFTNEARVTILSNWLYRINDKHKITFKNLFNQIGENATILREGLSRDQRPGEILRNYQFAFSERRIYSGQFNGEHKLSDLKQIDWVLGGNYVNDNLPDLRRFRTFRNIDEPNEPFRMIDPPSSNLFDTSRFFAELTEYSTNAAVNYTHIIERVKNDEELENIVLKTGLFADYKNREFSSRYFSYLLPGGVTADRREELISLPLSDVFSPQNVNATNGWVFREGTNPADSYTATNMLLAGYIYGELPINKVLLTGGLRVEHNTLELNGFQGINPVLVSQPLTSFLPSLNISYNVNEKNVIRTAYFRSVNRPEFREIAPFLFYNFDEDTEVEGSPDLTTATIDNIDLRYEFYPNKGETMSFGLFYKKFDKPIEAVLPIVSQQRRMRFSNTESAFVYGAEIEVRKNFNSFIETGFLSHLNVNLNASYVISEIDFGNVDIAQDLKRPLQGQSPYVINFALGYDNRDNGWSANLIYNRIGDRIYAVGNNLFPTIFELARHQLDVSIAKTYKNTTYKLGVANLINDKYRFWQDTNRNSKINTNYTTEIDVFTNTEVRKYEDNPIFEHRNGVLFNFNVTYKF